MKKIAAKIVAIIVVIGLALIFSFLGGLVVSLIWNHVIVALFINLPMIKWWQAWLIMLLINLVFGHNSNKSK